MDPEMFIGVTDDSIWNGFLNVKVIPSEAAKIIKKYPSDELPPVGDSGIIDLSGGFATVEVLDDSR